MNVAPCAQKRICAVVPPNLLRGLDREKLSSLLAAIDSAGLCAAELWGTDSFLGESLTVRSAIDPWEQLRALRDGVKNTRLRLTLRGQSLLGRGIYADDVVEYLVARTAENGIGAIRVYDALNDPRNIETVMRAAKKYDLDLEAAMVYTTGPACSAAFYAGYASLLEGAGADRVCILDPEQKLDTQTLSELTSVVGGAISIPLVIGAGDMQCLSPRDILANDRVAGVDIDLCGIPAPIGRELLGGAWDEIKKALPLANKAAPTDGYSIPPDDYIERARHEAGWPTMAAPLDELIIERAAALYHSNGDAATPELSAGYRALVSGLYGRLPMPPSPDVMSALGGNASMVLTRPADLLEPELDTLRTEIAPYLEQAEDILTYAMAGDAAVAFFEHRKCERYGIDELNSVPSCGIHII